MFSQVWDWSMGGAGSAPQGGPALPPGCHGDTVSQVNFGLYSSVVLLSRTPNGTRTSSKIKGRKHVEQVCLTLRSIIMKLIVHNVGDAHNASTGSLIGTFESFLIYKCNILRIIISSSYCGFDCTKFYILPTVKSCIKPETHNGSKVAEYQCVSSQR